jgi:hypothetical protein
MLIFNVYGETVEEAREVAAMVQELLDAEPGSAYAVPSIITQEVRCALGISRYPAIVKNRVILWEGSSPSKAMVLQWIKDNYSQCDEISGAQGSFGYDKSNPIPADGNWYCRRLRCPSGHPYWYQRLGSCGWASDGHIVDHVHLLCFGRESEVFLYFDMYHKGASSLVPEGLLWEDAPSGRGTTSGMVDHFPEGLYEI